MIATEEVADSMEEDGNFYSTYGWHPLSVDVAIANIRYIIRHEKRLMANIAAMSSYFAERLAGMPFKRHAELRIRGLAIAVDFGDDDYASRLQEKCRKAGLLLSSESEGLLLLPALTIDRRTAKVGLDTLEECL